MLTQAVYDDIIHLALLNTAKNKICDGGGIGIRARLRGVSARVWVQVPSIAPNLRLRYRRFFVFFNITANPDSVDYAYLLSFSALAYEMPYQLRNHPGGKAYS